MKIGILTQYYPPEIGAPQARLSETARILASTGHEVVVLTAIPSYPIGKMYPGYHGVLKAEEIDGIRVLRTYCRPAAGARFGSRLANYLSFTGSSMLAGAVWLPRLDFLITETPPLFLGITGLLLSRLKRAKWILNVADLWPESAARLGVLQRGSFAFKLAEKLELFLYKRAWLVTCQSQGIQSDIMARYPGARLAHLSNGVDVDKFRPGCASAQVRSGLARSADECLVVYAGLHGLAQGLDLLLKAARIMADEKVRFALIGDGPKKKSLVAAAERLGLRNVRFCDPVPPPDVPAILASADIAVVPLAVELPGAVPSKMYEAMASGCPIILVGAGEPADIVNASGSGIVIQPGDLAGLVSALKTLVAHPELRRGLGGSGRAFAVASFNRRHLVEGFIKALEDGSQVSGQQMAAPRDPSSTRHPIRPA